MDVSAAFSLTNELSQSTNRRMNMVITIAFGLCTIYYMGVGVLGYWTFGDAVESNMLNNYPNTS